jgi:Zn-dependent M28 family amino/carboxypeptidase
MVKVSRKFLKMVMGAVACTAASAAVVQATEAAVATSLHVDPQRLMAHVRVLSSDEFEGRAPASAGERKTIEYLVRQFRTLGLQPGNGDSFLQKVPMVALTTSHASPIRVRTEKARLEFPYGSAMVVNTRHEVPAMALNDVPMVFVGYGIRAPEYQWDDYADVDVRGKVAVMLVNDPGFGSGDPKLFKGKTMTYYGRWTYKYEEASRQGALGAIIIHQTADAGYPWEVVRNSWTGPQFSLPGGDKGAKRVRVEGWIDDKAASELLATQGWNLDDIKKRAATRGFRAMPMKATMSVSFDNAISHTDSFNVVARIPGSRFPDESLLYTAHWDHLGKHPDMKPDGIFNGALDNASGTAALLELARLYAQGPRPERTVMFIALTGEEQGLLGSAYLAEHPLVDLEKTVALFNMDGINPYGPTRDVVVIGAGQSDLETDLQKAAAAQHRVVVPETSPEKGFYFRSDHFSLAKKGVPALYIKSGLDDVAHGRAYGQQKMNDYIANRYHKPSDEIQADWTFAGGALDVDLLFAIGNELAHSRRWPQWLEGSEFRAIRKASESKRLSPGNH